MSEWCRDHPDVEHSSQNMLNGRHAVHGDSFRAEVFHFHQTPEKFGLWFSWGDDVPRSHWAKQEDKEIVFWFSPRTKPWIKSIAERGVPPRHFVGGIEIPFQATLAVYPITSIWLDPTDLK